MATITLRNVKGSPLTIAELDDNFTAINTDLGTRQLESTNTGSDILTKLKTVDGSGSGLDADLLMVKIQHQQIQYQLSLQEILQATLLQNKSLQTHL